MNQRILVLGSTGNVGRPLVESLRAAGETVRAATRRPVQEDDVRLEVSDASTFAPALDGVDRVFVVSPPGHYATHELLGPFLREAFARPRQFVLLSAEGVQFNEQAPLRQVERLIEASGHPYVFLRNNWFMDNFHTFWLAPMRAAGIIPVPAGDARTAFIDAADIAAAAAAAFRTSRFDGQSFSLSGPEALSYTEAAAILSRHAGREIRYQPLDDEAFVQSLVAAGMPADYSQFLAGLFGFVRQGAASEVTEAVQRLTGRAPATLEDYARRYATRWS